MNTTWLFFEFWIPTSVNFSVITSLGVQGEDFKNSVKSSFVQLNRIFDETYISSFTVTHFLVKISFLVKRKIYGLVANLNFSPYSNFFTEFLKSSPCSSTDRTVSQNVEPCVKWPIFYTSCHWFQCKKFWNDHYNSGDYESVGKIIGRNLIIW